MTLSERRKELNRHLAAHSHAARTVEEERGRLAAAKQSEADAGTAQRIVQEVAEQVQNRVHQRIAAVVTRCLKTVFGKHACVFKLAFVQKRGKTEAEMSFVKDGVEMAEPLDESSGGQVEVAALALRLVTLMMEMPRRRRLIVADEPFRSVHGEAFRERLAAMLPVLADELDFQLIIATGLSWLQIGKVIDLSR